MINSGNVNPNLVGYLNGKPTDSEVDTSNEKLNELDQKASTICNQLLNIGRESTESNRTVSSEVDPEIAALLRKPSQPDEKYLRVFKGVIPSTPDSSRERTESIIPASPRLTLTPLQQIAPSIDRWLEKLEADNDKITDITGKEVENIKMQQNKDLIKGMPAQFYKDLTRDAIQFNGQKLSEDNFNEFKKTMETAIGKKQFDGVLKLAQQGVIAGDRYGDLMNGVLDLQEHLPGDWMVMPNPDNDLKINIELNKPKEKGEDLTVWIKAETTLKANLIDPKSNEKTTLAECKINVAILAYANGEAIKKDDVVGTYSINVVPKKFF